MVLEYVLLATGLFLLVKGANYLIDSASDLGKLFNVKPLIIGLTVLAFGTSLPELFINLFASFEGQTDINLGNIIGSNIANTLLILGAVTLFIGIKIKNEVIKKGIPFTILATALLLLLVNDFLFGDSASILSRVDGIILLIFFTFFLYYAFAVVKGKGKIVPEEIEPPRHGKFVNIITVFGGILALFLGGKLVIDSAITIASGLGISKFLLSATVLAIGTSLPELVVSIIAAMKKNVDFVVGNIIGSNLFNIFMVLGISSVIRPIPFNSMFNFDIIFLFAISSMLLVFMFVGKKRQLERWNSLLFLALYVFYISFIIYRG